MCLECSVGRRERHGRPDSFDMLQHSPCQMRWGRAARLTLGGLVEGVNRAGTVPQGGRTLVSPLLCSHAQQCHIANPLMVAHSFCQYLLLFCPWPRFSPAVAPFAGRPPAQSKKSPRLAIGRKDTRRTAASGATAASVIIPETCRIPYLATGNCLWGSNLWLLQACWG